MPVALWPISFDADVSPGIARGAAQYWARTCRSCQRQPFQVAGAAVGQLTDIRQSIFGHVFLGCSTCCTTGLAILIFAILSVYWGTAVGSQASDFLGSGGNCGPRRRFHEKEPRGRNTSLSLAYERVNERAEWFGRQPVQPNLRFRKRVRIMKASLKSFAAFVVTIGISGLGTANMASASGHDSRSGSSHASSSHSSSGPSRSMSNSQGSKSSYQLDKHDSYKHDHYWDKGSYCHSYGCYPWNFCYSSYCYPCYRPYCQPCYAPSHCCEYAPPCQEYCPPVCYQEPCEYCPQPCYPYCPEYCGEYCYGSRYCPWDRCYDRYKDRDYRRDRDEFKGRQDSSKLSHDSHNSKSPVTGGPKGNSGMSSMGKLASHTSGISSGSHGSRR